MVIETEHVLEVLQKAKEAVKREDIVDLKELSNQTIHSASINQDTDSITIAVIIYSLSKILERTNYKDYSGWNTFIKDSLRHLDKAITALKKNDEQEFLFNIRKIRKDIARLTGAFRDQVKDVFRKAEINKASKIYEHGISMEQTSKLLGISIWDLASYTGQSSASDVNLTITLDIRKRIKNAEEIFS